MPFLALLKRLIEREGPDVLLTYGGHWLAARIIALARRLGVKVVFALHNFAYTNPAFFRNVDAVLLPSRFSRDYHRRELGLECTALPSPINWARIQCLNRMINTADPRRFYRLSRLVLMPSLWNESFGRVAAESLLNGIPVLGSRRGALPEVLQDAGFLFDIPERYTPTSRLVPTAEEVSPWVETILSLSDDPARREQERRRCLAAAQAWRPERQAEQYDAFFHQLLDQRS